MTNFGPAVTLLLVPRIGLLCLLLWKSASRAFVKKKSALFPNDINGIWGDPEHYIWSLVLTLLPEMDVVVTLTFYITVTAAPLDTFRGHAWKCTELFSPKLENYRTRRLCCLQPGLRLLMRTVVGTVSGLTVKDDLKGLEGFDTPPKWMYSESAQLWGCHYHQLLKTLFFSTVLPSEDLLLWHFGCHTGSLPRDGLWVIQCRQFSACHTHSSGGAQV